MPIVLPLGVFVFLWVIFSRSGDSTRDAALRACVFCVSLLVFMTEILSAAHRMTRTGLVCGWLAVLLCAAVLMMRGKKEHVIYSAGRPTGMVHLPPHLSLVDVALGASIFLCLAVVGLVAIIAPPNSWDAMEHILPRVIFWVSNHSVGVYPTPDYAQLLKGPGAEFVALHSYLLWGGDRLLNLTEFFALFGSAVAASLIAGKLGAQRTGQLLSALFVVTVPVAVLEASGSMTSVVASFWIVTACYFMLQAGKMESTRETVAAGLAAGLALLTQPIMFAYLPVMLLGCLLFRPAAAWVWTLKRLPLFAVLVLALNAGQFVRNEQVTGTLLARHFAGGGPRMDFSNDHLDPLSIAANVLRQTALQMGTPVSKLNGRIEGVMRKAITLVGRDPDDASASWSAIPFYMDHPTRLETQAGNPVQFLIIVLCFVAVLLMRTEAKDKRVLWFSGAIVFAFIAYCAFIRWQPWGSRFHLPLFMLAAATVGFVVERLFIRRWLILCFAMFLVVVALPYLVSNSSRSVLRTKNFPTIFEPRRELYFGDQHTALVPAYTAMAESIRASRCSRIGIDAYLPIEEPKIGMSPQAFYIYPLLALIGIDGETRSVHYINVQNPTKKFDLGAQGGTDCAVICLTCKLSEGRKSDAAIGQAQVFGNSELVFPATTK